MRRISLVRHLANRVRDLARLPEDGANWAGQENYVTLGATSAPGEWGRREGLALLWLGLLRLSCVDQYGRVRELTAADYREDPVVTRYLVRTARYVDAWTSPSRG